MKDISKQLTGIGGFIVGSISVDIEADQKTPRENLIEAIDHWLEWVGAAHMGTKEFCQNVQTAGAEILGPQVVIDWPEVWRADAAEADEPAVK